MLLKSGTYWADRWNETVLPAIKAGKIVQLSCIPKKFRREHQLYGGMLMEGGLHFRITAWGYPGNDPHVHVEMIGRNKPK